MSTIEETVEIAVPVRTAYNQWTQFKVFPRFVSAVKGVEQIKPTLTRWDVGFGPAHREWLVEIVEQRPDAYVRWQVLGTRRGGEVSFRSLSPDRTSVTAGVGPADALGVTRRVLRSGLGDFKEFIEGLGEESGAWRGAVHNGHVVPAGSEPLTCHGPHWPHG
ncbi:SRPBCC family protein [Streptomyces sp. CRN 30]|uniref:SRPBCC family protein n=1 Tax=Streptomyces sp. CRN 30 TaxID=3075613 RepID=UPI002A7F0F7E|nr:SRPBCC family protein [Streptomyces sp. CRN 30]